MIEFIQHNDFWEVINQGSPELSSNTHGAYASLFDLDCCKPKRVLIIGGGDYQLAKLIYDRNPLAQIHLVDPCVDGYEPYHSLMWGNDLPKVIKYPMTFGVFISEAMPDNTQFDQIFVDCSSYEVPSTDEIYCEAFLNQLSIFDCPCVQMYVDYTRTDIVRDYLVDNKLSYTLASRFVPHWNETPHVYKFNLNEDVR